MRIVLILNTDVISAVKVHKAPKQLWLNVRVDAPHQKKIGKNRKDYNGVHLKFIIEFVLLYLTLCYRVGQFKLFFISQAIELPPEGW